MFEALTNSVEELKRVDHLIYVSLKYTRTVDVIRSVVNRIIEAFNAIIDGFLEKLESENKIEEIPMAPMVKVQHIKENCKDEDLHEYLDFYIFLRQLYRADFTRSGEFRKNVAMTSTMSDGKIIEVKINTVLEYYEKTKLFVHYIKDNYVENDDDE